MSSPIFGQLSKLVPGKVSHSLPEFAKLSTGCPPVPEFICTRNDSGMMSMLAFAQ